MRQACLPDCSSSLDMVNMPKYNPQHNCRTLSDMQFVSWVLSCFSSIDEVVGALSDIELVTLHNAIGSVHWRISEPSGRMVVLEVVGGSPSFL